MDAFEGVAEQSWYKNLPPILFINNHISTSAHNDSCSLRVMHISARLSVPTVSRKSGYVISQLRGEYDSNFPGSWVVMHLK